MNVYVPYIEVHSKQVIPAIKTEVAITLMSAVYMRNRLCAHDFDRAIRTQS